MPKAVDVVPDVGRKRCYGLFIKFTALKSELLQLFAHHKHVVEDHTVGDQVIELDNFALFLPAVLSDDSLSVNLLTSWEEFRSFLGRFGLFDVAIQCRAGPRNVQISSHEVSKFTQG